MKGPHRVIGDIVDGLVNGINGLGTGVVNAIKGVGESVMGGLDKPFTGVTGMQGPHRAIDKAAKGVIDAGSNFASQGIIGSAKTAGEGLMKALDHPLEQISKGKFELPKILKK